MSRHRFRLSLVLGAFTTVLTMIAADVADARGRVSGGSRGSRTHSAPPATTTAPAVRPVERSVTQPSSPATTAPAARPVERSAQPSSNSTIIVAPRPGQQQQQQQQQATPQAAAAPMAAAAPVAPRPGFSDGLFRAGVVGLVLGAGLTGGLGGLTSFLGLALQIIIVAAIGWALFGLMPGRSPSPANAAVQSHRPPRNRSEFGLRSASPR